MNIGANSEAMKAPGPVEQPARDFSTGFDYRTHIKDAKTGRLIRLQHYARHARSGEVLLERPVGSGNAFTENGEPAGRWDFNTWKKISPEHIEVAQPPANPMEALQQENETMRNELEALRAEAKALATAAGKRKD